MMKAKSQHLRWFRNTAVTGLACLVIGCFAEKLEKLPFFTAATVDSEIEGLGEVRLYGVVEGADDRALEIGFLLSSVNPEPNFDDGDVNTIPVPRPSQDERFEFNQLVAGLDEFTSTYYYRAFAKNQDRKMLGEVKTFSLIGDFDFRITQVSASNIFNNAVTLEGIVLGLEGLRESVADHGFVLGLERSQLVLGKAIAEDHLERLNDDGSFLGAIANLDFNTSYLARAFIVTEEGVPIYSRNITEFRIEDGWLKEDETVFDKAFLNGVAVTIGDLAYVGMGCGKYCDQSEFVRYLWQFDPATGSLQEMAPFPAIGRGQAVAFAAKGKVYFGLGFNTVFNNDKYFDDFWEFDPATNEWRQVKTFPGGGRYGAIAFALGDQGYVGTGRSPNLTFHSDFYLFHPPETAVDSGRWERLDRDLPLLAQPGSTPLGAGRYDAVAFTIGDNAYVGTGRYFDLYSKDAYDFWKFDPLSQNWESVAFLGEDAGAERRHNATAFAIGNKGYLCLGFQRSPEFDPFLFSDLWEFTPNATAKGTWVKRTDFQGKMRRGAVGFSSETRKEGYVAGGESFSNNEAEITVFNDLWKYIPAGE